MKRPFAAVLLWLSACGTSSDSPPAPAPVPATAPLTCEARVRELEVRLAHTPDAPPLTVPDDLELPASSTGAAIDADGPTVVLRADGRLQLDGEHVSSSREVRDRLDALLRMHDILHPGEGPPVVFVAAETGVASARIREVLGARSERILVLGRDPTPASVPPCPESLASLCPRLGPAGSAARTALLSEAWTRALGSCDDLVRMHRAIANTHPTTRAQILRRGLSEGLRACECERGLDLEAIEYLALVTLGAPFSARLLATPLP